MKKPKKIILRMIVASALGVLLLLGTGLVMLNISGEADELRNDIRSLQTRVSLLEAKDANRNAVVGELSQLEADLKAFQALFPSAIVQEETIVTLRGMEERSGCTLDRLSYQPLQLDTANQTVDANLLDQSGVTAPIAGMGMKMPVDVTLRSDYENMRRFLGLVADSKQKIGMHEIRLSLTDEPTGSVKLEFYGFLPAESEK